MLMLVFVTVIDIIIIIIIVVVVVVVVVVFILVANYINPRQRRDYRGIWMNLLAKYFGVGLRPILAANLTIFIKKDSLSSVFV